MAERERAECKMILEGTQVLILREGQATGS